MAISVLIVEDDKNIAELLQMYLEKEGYAVTIASDGGQGVSKFRAIKPDLVLLDLMLPVMDGWAVCKTIRSESQTPIIMLTAKGETTDKVNGLRSGADDYITKPFGTEELLARIRAALRHGQRMAEGEKSVYNIGGLQVDTERRIVRVDGREVHLTQIEYKIVTLLCRNAGKVLTHDSMIREVWGPFSGCDTQLLRVNMANIRRKIEKDPAMPEYILTEIGVGYRMAEGQEGR